MSPNTKAVHVFHLLRKYCDTNDIASYHPIKNHPFVGSILTELNILVIVGYKEWFQALYEKLHQKDNETDFPWELKVAVVTVLLRCKFKDGPNEKDCIYDVGGFYWLDEADQIHPLVREYNVINERMKSGEEITISIGKENIRLY